MDEGLAAEAKMRYDGERLAYMTPYPEVRDRLNGDACHDVALDLGIDADELADYIERVEGYRPDPRTNES